MELSSGIQVFLLSSGWNLINQTALGFSLLCAASTTSYLVNKCYSKVDQGQWEHTSPQKDLTQTCVVGANWVYS